MEKKTFSAETKAQAVEMVKSGKTIKEVAEYFGTSAVTVGRWTGGKAKKPVALKTSNDFVKVMKAKIAELDAEKKALEAALKVMLK